MFAKKEPGSLFCFATGLFFVLQRLLFQKASLFTKGDSTQAQIVELKGIGCCTVSNGNGTGFAIQIKALCPPGRPY